MRDGKLNDETRETLVQVFEQHSSQLYWLAFLLTGDPEQGVAAFTTALDVEQSANAGFRDFMLSWARRLVIAASLDTMRPALRESALRLERSAGRDSTALHGPVSPSWIRNQNITGQDFEQAVLKIDLFPRCALLLTVFERLSIDDASVLLNARQDLVKTARREGLMALTRNIALLRGRKQRCSFFYKPAATLLMGA